MQDTFKVKIIIAALIMVFVAIGASSYITYEKSHMATVNLYFQLGGNKAFIRFNGKPVKSETNDGYKYTLHSGYTQLNITEQGYKDYSTSFVLKPGGTNGIYVSLVPESKPSATNLNKIVTNVSGVTSFTSLENQYPEATAKAKYFDNETWAYLTVQTHVGPGFAYYIVKFNKSLGRWVIVSGPQATATNIGGVNLESMPQDLQNYLKTLDNGY